MFDLVLTILNDQALNASQGAFFYKYLFEWGYNLLIMQTSYLKRNISIALVILSLFTLYIWRPHYTCYIHVHSCFPKNQKQGVREEPLMQPRLSQFRVGHLTVVTYNIMSLTSV